METSLIEVLEVEKELEAGEDFKILDVRTKEEYDAGHIKGSIFLAIEDVENEIENLIPDKNAKIYIVCRSGGRSAMAQSILKEKGYTNTKNIVGGMLEWQEKGLPIEN